MIKKTTEAICDNCGTGIYHIPENLSYKEFAESLKERNIALVRYLPGRRNPYIFCNEKCLKEWAERNDYDMLGNQDISMEHDGCWIMRDGSYIPLGTAHHNRFLQEYLGYKEYDMERFWVKVSLGTAHIHDKLTNQQWETVNKLKKKYNLILEKLGDW